MARKFEIEEMRNYTVVKSNDLVQKARFQLTIQEQKIILYLISKIKPDTKDFSQQEFSILEFCRVCGIDYDNGKNYKNVKETIKKLSDKSVWVYADTDSETLIRWMEKVWINKRDGIIRLRLDDDMKPYLLELKKHFTKYELIYTLAMRSQYSIRLYEILKSYAYMGNKEFYIEDLKKILFAENYERYPDFRRKVLEISAREINDLSDIFVEYEVIKIGRKFGKIKFLIRSKVGFEETTSAWLNRRKILDREVGVKK